MILAGIRKLQNYFPREFKTNFNGRGRCKKNAWVRRPNGSSSFFPSASLLVLWRTSSWMENKYCPFCLFHVGLDWVNVPTQKIMAGSQWPRFVGSFVTALCNWKRLHFPKASALPFVGKDKVLTNLWVRMSSILIMDWKIKTLWDSFLENQAFKTKTLWQEAIDSRFLAKRGYLATLHVLVIRSLQRYFEEIVYWISNKMCITCHENVPSTS